MRRSLFLAILLACGLAHSAAAATLRVAVAISLKEALTQIAQNYQVDTGDHVVLTCGASGQLATQIKNDAPVDVFISAASKQVDDLAQDHLIDPATRAIVARNTLVLVVPAGAPAAPVSFATLDAPTITKLAIGDPQSVPAGAYAIQVLTALKIADRLGGRLVYGANVRQVLTYVEMGAVSAGIVYATDALQSADKVKVVATAPPGTHQPIVYPGAVLATSKQRERAGRFLTYLGTDKSRKILAARGFIVEAPAAGTDPSTAPAK